MIEIKKSTLYFWLVVFVLQVLFILWYKGVLPSGWDNISPLPAPASSITVSSQDEYDVVVGALDFVSNEWALSRYTSVHEAKQGLSAMMGGTTGGVDQKAFASILASFKEDCDFLGVAEELKRKIKIQ